MKFQKVPEGSGEVPEGSGEVPEGSGADTVLRFRRGPVQIPC